MKSNTLSLHSKKDFGWYIYKKKNCNLALWISVTYNLRSVIRCVSAFYILFPDAAVLVFITAYFMKCQPSVDCSRSIVSDQSRNIKGKNLNSWLIFVLHRDTNKIASAIKDEKSSDKSPVLHFSKKYDCLFVSPISWRATDLWGNIQKMSS